MERPAESSPAGSRPEPRIVVCAWCGASGQQQSAVRGWDAPNWQPVSHAFAQVTKRAGFASHGICPDCCEREMHVIEEAAELEQADQIITPRA
jgi:hypothetical protein